MTQEVLVVRILCLLSLILAVSAFSAETATTSHRVANAKPKIFITWKTVSLDRAATTRGKKSPGAATRETIARPLRDNEILWRSCAASLQAPCCVSPSHRSGKKQRTSNVQRSTSSVQRFPRVALSEG